MSNQHIEMQKIRRLISVWITEIKLNNYESYFDINKVGEHISRQLLNKIFDHKLEDLNKIKKNFPGLDIGDMTKDYIAYQVTSRTDNSKVIENLETVVSNKYQNTFTGGIRFLILNDSKKISFGKKAKKKPTDILSSFKINDDIIYPEDLIQKIENVYEIEADLIKFNEIKIFLEKQLFPIISGQPLASDNVQTLTDLLKELNKLSEKDQPQLNVSNNFLHGDLKPPPISIISNRQETIDNLWKHTSTTDVLWLQGAVSTGKTSLAVLLTKKTNDKVLWFECRDIQAEQILEQILDLHLSHLSLKPGANLSDTLGRIFDATSDISLIVFNDLTDLQKHKLIQGYLGQYFAVAAKHDIPILVTSNYMPPADISSASGIEFISETVPPFTVKDSEEVLQSLSAPHDKVPIYAKLITQVTEGHPLLIQAAAKFLSTHNWQTDDDVIKNIFSGKFGIAAEKEGYGRVLEHTTDADMREVLYRLRCVIGDFSSETVQRICNINPVITHPGEKINQLLGIWLQPIKDQRYQLSPLIKFLDKNIPPDLEKEINKQLGLEITEKANISQLEALNAILYFTLANSYNNAAIVLIKVLDAFVDNPELFFDWGFNLYWFSTQLPEEVLPLFKIQIRVFHINLSLKKNMDVSFLVSDLKDIISKNDPGLLGGLLSEMIFFQINFPDNPLAAFENLIKIQKAEKELPPLAEELFTEEYFDGIWIIFSKLHTKEEYQRWFELFNTFENTPARFDAQTNELYIMAAVSIYRNAILRNKNNGSDIEDLLHWLIDISQQNNLLLISSYSIKYLIKFLGEQGKEPKDVASLIDQYQNTWQQNPIYKFLIFAELGRSFFLKNQIEAAYYYLTEVWQIQLPLFYTESLDFYIVFFQVAYRKNPDSFVPIITEALRTANGNERYHVEDKVKLFGEVAIGLTNAGKYIEALGNYEEGYALLMDNFNANEEQQAIVIRYGNAIQYLDQLMQEGVANKYGDGKFIIPQPGYFYNSNEKLLDGGFYFAERKFMVAHILQSAYEGIGDYTKAKKWAYKTIEYSQEVENAQYVPILQSILYYLVDDKQYRQAYNIMAYIEDYYSAIRKKIESGEAVDENLKTSFQTLKNNDLSLYFFILLPITLNLSLDICLGRIQKEEYAGLIDKAFASDKYILKDPSSFAFAKKLFEDILIKRISAKDMQDIFKEYKNTDLQEVLYIIGSILMSSFSTATEAAVLQLTVLINLDSVVKKMKALYRFLIVPYFENFWKQKIITHPAEFTGKELLQSKGLKLINQSTLDSKIQTIFRVISDHLEINPSSAIRDFIDPPS